MDFVALKYNGEPNKPDWCGKIPPLTPIGGVKPGDSFEISEELMNQLHRDPSYESRTNFALFLAAIYNRRGKAERWTVVSWASAFIPPESPEPLQSDEDDDNTDGGTSTGLAKATEETD